MVASTTKIHSSPSTQTDPGQVNNLNRTIRECAMRILGSGYSRANGGSLLGKVVVNLTEQEVRILEDRTQFVLAKVANERQLSSAMKQRFGVAFCESLAASEETGMVENTQTSDALFVVQGINHVRCDCITNPVIQNEPTNSADSYVREASFYCGYQILIRTSTDFQDTMKQNQQDCVAVVSPALLNYKSSDLYKQLYGKNIEHVEIRGFGGYHPPVCSAGLDIESIERAINETDAHFKREFPKIVNRDHDIDPQLGVSPYESINRDCFVQKQQIQIPPSSQTNSSISPTEFPTLTKDDLDTVLNDLAIDVRTSCKNTYVKDTKFAISKIFKTMHEIFPQIVSSKPRGITPFTLVIGDSGAGKSLHIGYLLCADLQIREDGKLDYACPNLNLPVIGHEATAQTLGCQMYKRYMDCAGFLDNRGEEVDICNVMAISMMNQKFSPNRLIVVIPYTHLSGAKPPLLKFIKELKKIINLNDDKVLSSTMFIFSDPDGLSAKAPPEILLQRAIKGITAIRDKQLPERLKHLANKSWTILLGKNEASSEDFSKIEPTQAEQIKDANEEKEILERLMNQGNFMVSNLLSEDTRKKIQQWENNFEIEHFPAESLRIEKIVGEASLCFRSILAATATYFNDLRRNQILFEEKIKQTEIDIKSTKAIIESMQKEVSNPGGFDQKLIEEQNTDFRRKLSEKKEKLTTLEKSLENKEKEIKTLDTNDPQLLKELSPSEIIQPRSGWSRIGDFLAKSYEFKGTTYPVSFLEYRTSDGGTGTFYDYKFDQKTDEHSIWYYPKYKAEKPHASVSLFVRQREHPETQNKLKTLNDQINHPKTGLKDQIATLKTEIKGLEFKVKEINMQQRLGSSIVDLKKYENQRGEDIADKDDLIAKLERYQEFRQLLGKIIDSLRDMDLAHNEKGCEEDTFKEFFRLFPK